MSSQRTLRRAVLAASLLVAFLSQGTWALAGVTGNIAGTVKDANGAPIAGVSVRAVSPSQTASATTDAGGHFILLSLAPDTYTLDLTRDGFQPTAVPGTVVFADQTQQVAITMQRALKTIARVTSQAGAALVKSGVGGDLYSVNPATQQASVALGGGGSLESMYSAIATTPGLVIGTGGMGWNQAVVVRGQNPWTTGFEYDGIPMNRAFDNYTSSTGSNLGLQELEVYTGGGPGSISSSGISGFINQVIKTGTFPGYGNLYGAIGTNPFYHSARVEAGGSTPDRTFSYYIGLSGYNQAFNYVDNNNGAPYAAIGQPLGTYSCGLFCNSPAGPAIAPVCNLVNSLPTNPLTDGCDSYSFAWEGGASPGFITDRENVVNFHVGIPHPNGLRDDVQLMWSASALRTVWNNSMDQSGPGVQNWTALTTGLPYCPNLSGCSNKLSPLCGTAPCPYNVPHYVDAITYNLPFGTNVAPGGDPLPYQWYYQPNSPQNRAPLAPIPLGRNDNNNNDEGIVKLQYTHALSERAFIRAYGYSFFSDWTLDGQNCAFSYDVGYCPGSPNYMLITHTSGGQLMFADQFNDQNLFQISGNATYASTVRFNNTGYLAPSYFPLLGCPLAVQAQFGCVGTSKVGYISDHNGNFTCYDPTSGAAEPCIPGGSWYTNPYHINNPGSGGLPFGPPGSPAAKAGAYYAQIWNGNAQGTYNTVRPQFYNGEISDQFRPNDKWLFNVALRYDDFNYGLANTNTIQNQFWGQIVQKYVCWKGVAGSVLVNPLGPGVFPPPTPVLEATCPTGYTHPGSAFSVSSPSSYNIYYWQPRYSVTYTESPDTVWRFSGGRYAEPPLTAAVQYQNLSGNATSLWANFLNAGFTSPFHPLPGETSAQYDLSYEHHVRGTDLSFKITPFYGLTSNWEQQSFIGAGFVTQIPVGRYQNYGAEFALTKGDFSRNGFSGQLAFTYTHAYTQYQSGIVPNQINTLNTLIMNYNCLTKSGYNQFKGQCNNLGYSAPSQCYEAGKPSACNAPPIQCTTSTAVCFTPVLNAYYNEPAQSLQNPNGWYPGTIYQLQPSLGPGYAIYAQGYASPYVASLVASWRHDKLAITPSFQWQSGTYYGSPMDVVGTDPRVCALNQGNTGVATTNNPLDCDYRHVAGPGAAAQFGYLYIPNPATGQFSNIGQFVEPNIAIGNMQVSYDPSPKVRLQATLTNIFHVCWGGTSAAWTSTYSPGGVYCGYNSNSLYVGKTPGQGWFNGASPNDKKANGVTPYAWQTQPYFPLTGNGIGSYLPFNAYFSATVKL